MIGPCVPPIRCVSLIDAPPSVVRRVLRRSDVWVRAATAAGAALEVAGDPPTLGRGALVRFRRPGRGRALLLRVAETAGLPTLESAIARGRQHARVRVLLTQTADGTVTTVELAVATACPLLDSALRPTLVRYGEMLLGIAALAACEPVRVVAGAVVAAGRVLLARRKATADGPGRWELPGGKVEPGETDEQALIRELLEELAIHARVFRQIGQMVTVEPGIELVCYRAEMVSNGPIELVDHDSYAWVGPDELHSVDLLESDRELVESLRTMLQILS